MRSIDPYRSPPPKKMPRAANGNQISSPHRVRHSNASRREQPWIEKYTSSRFYFFFLSNHVDDISLSSRSLRPSLCPLFWRSLVKINFIDRYLQYRRVEIAIKAYPGPANYWRSYLPTSQVVWITNFFTNFLYPLFTTLLDFTYNPLPRVQILLISSCCALLTFLLVWSNVRTSW